MFGTCSESADGAEQPWEAGQTQPEEQGGMWRQTVRAELCCVQQPQTLTAVSGDAALTDREV